MPPIRAVTPASMRRLFALLLGACLCAAPSSSPSCRAQPEISDPSAAVVVPLECAQPGRDSYGARLTLASVRAFKLAAPAGDATGATTTLHAVRLDWAWPPLESEAGFSRVSFALTPAAGTIVDLYPRSVNAPLPVDGALGVDAQQRFRLVPPGPRTLPIGPWTATPSGRMHDGWAHWSVAAPEREALPPGEGTGYVLMHLPGTPSHLELRVRLRAHVGTWLFGRLRSHCVAAAADRTLSLPLDVLPSPESSPAPHDGDTRPPAPRAFVELPRRP